MVLIMPILFFNNTNVEFAELKKSIWRLCILIEALPTTSRVKLISKRKFIKMVLNKNSETFVVYILDLEAITI